MNKGVNHGGYGTETRFDITQHKYAGGGNSSCGGYIEVLEIKEPPDGRHGIIIHEWNTTMGHSFSEWKTLQDAIDAFNSFWGWNPRTIKVGLSKLHGFIRYVECGNRKPWFYAKNEDLLSLEPDFVYQCENEKR